MSDQDMTPEKRAAYLDRLEALDRRAESIDWRSLVPTWIPIVLVVVLYSVIGVVAVNGFGWWGILIPVGFIVFIGLLVGLELEQRRKESESE